MVTVHTAPGTTSIYQIREVRYAATDAKIGSVVARVTGGEVKVVWPKFERLDDLAELQVSSHDSCEDWVMMNELPDGEVPTDYHESHKHPSILITSAALADTNGGHSSRFPEAGSAGPVVYRIRTVELAGIGHAGSVVTRQVGSAPEAVVFPDYPFEVAGHDTCEDFVFIHCKDATTVSYESHELEPVRIGLTSNMGGGTPPAPETAARTDEAQSVTSGSGFSLFGGLKGIVQQAIKGFKEEPDIAKGPLMPGVRAAMDYAVNHPGFSCHFRAVCLVDGGRRDVRFVIRQYTTGSPDGKAQSLYEIAVRANVDGRYTAATIWHRVDPRKNLNQYEIDTRAGETAAKAFSRNEAFHVFENVGVVFES